MNINIKYINIKYLWMYEEDHAECSLLFIDFKQTWIYQLILVITVILKLVKKSCVTPLILKFHWNPAAAGPTDWRADIKDYFHKVYCKHKIAPDNLNVFYSNRFVFTVSRMWYLLENCAWVRANRRNDKLSLLSCIMLQ